MNNKDQNNLEELYELTLLESYVDQLNIPNQELIVEKEEVLNEGLTAALSAFATSWATYLSSALLWGAGVLTLAKLFAWAMKWVSKRLDKNIEEKQKIIDTIISNVYQEREAETLKNITKKLDNNEQISEEELTSLKKAHEEINENLKEKLEKQYKQGKRENIAKALYLASKAVESKVGLLASFIGGLWIFSSISKMPELDTSSLPNLPKDRTDPDYKPSEGWSEPITPDVSNSDFPMAVP